MSSHAGRSNCPDRRLCSRRFSEGPWCYRRCPGGRVPAPTHLIVVEREGGISHHHPYIQTEGAEGKAPLRNACFEVVLGAKAFCYLMLCSDLSKIAYRERSSNRAGIRGVPSTRVGSSLPKRNTRSRLRFPRWYGSGNSVQGTIPCICSARKREKINESSAGRRRAFGQPKWRNASCFPFMESATFILWDGIRETGPDELYSDRTRTWGRPVKTDLLFFLLFSGTRPPHTVGIRSRRYEQRLHVFVRACLSLVSPRTRDTTALSEDSVPIDLKKACYTKCFFPVTLSTKCISPISSATNKLVLPVAVLSIRLGSSAQPRTARSCSWTPLRCSTPPAR